MVQGQQRNGKERLDQIRLLLSFRLHEQTAFPNGQNKTFVLQVYILITHRVETTMDNRWVLLVKISHALQDIFDLGIDMVRFKNKTSGSLLYFS